MACPLRSPEARSLRSSARADPGSRHCCSVSPASCSPTAGTSGIADARWRPSPMRFERGSDATISASSSSSASAFLGSLGVDDVAESRAGEMSGGQAQRVAVARALVSRPRVIFADEPTGSLDSTNGELVMELLVSTARRQGSSVVLVTHEPQVAAYADRETVVRDGRLAHAVALV